MSILAVVFTSFFIVVSGSHNNLNNVLFSGDYEFIDLTYPFDNRTVYWPDSQNFMFTNKNEGRGLDGSWYAANDFTSGEHGGTHIDAPYHFTMSGKHVDEIPLENLIVPMVVVDISSKVSDDPAYVLYKRDLDYMLNDNFGKPVLILFKFGWGKFFYDRTKYLGYNAYKNTLNFPGISAEVAEWITTSYKNVVGIGVDVPSVDPGSSSDFPVHKITSRAGLYSIENVNFNRSIPDYGCTALVLPMKIASGSGAPLRLVAICPKQTPTMFGL